MKLVDGPQMVSIFSSSKKEKKRKKKKTPPWLYERERLPYYYLRYILDIDTWCMYPLATSRSGLVLEIITYRYLIVR